MEVSVVGKALNPISHQYVPFFEQTNNSPLGTAYLQYSRRGSNAIPSIKAPVKLSLSTNSTDVNNWIKDTASEITANSKSDRDSAKWTPAVNKAVVSGTYEITKLKLTSKTPVPKFYQDERLTPKLAFSRVSSSTIVRDVSSKEGFDSTRSMTPEILCGPQSKDAIGVPNRAFACENVIEKSKSVFANLVQDKNTHSSPSALYGFRNRRRKSARRKRKSRQEYSPSENYKSKTTGDQPQGEKKSNFVCRPTEIFLRNKLLPPRTQSSFIVLKNTCNTSSKIGKGDEIILPHHTRSSQLNNNNNSNVKSLLVDRIIHRSSLWKVDKKDPLLSSIDSALSHKAKNEKQLSMRIQLIHKYGNEDVLKKHMEMKRKREVANKHEKKLLEAQAATKLKQIQRSKIYALNDLMTKLEQEQFKEYKQSV